jgi:hypothetical protein
MLGFRALRRWRVRARAVVLIMLAGLIVLVPTSWAGYRDTVLLHSPAGYWQFNESSGTSAADETANGNTGTYQNGAVLGVDGVLNDESTAVSLDGTNDYVKVPNHSSLNPTGALTLEAWLKPSSGGFATIKPVFAKGYTSHTPPYYQYQLSIVDNGSFPKYIQPAFPSVARGSILTLRTPAGSTMFGITLLRPTTGRR